MTAPVFSYCVHKRLMGVLLLAVLPWVVMNFNMVGNADNLWLAEGYLRFARGEGLRESFFEVNPPLSFLLYAIPAEMSARLGVALTHAIFLYALCVVGLASWAIFKLLKPFSFLSAEDRFILCSSFIIASTLMATGFFAERDHFVAMGLVLLLLIQLRLTLYGGHGDLVTGAIAFIGAFFLLLKPHFLLIPALLLFHRAWKRRSLLAVIRDADFQALFLAGFFYGALLLWLFQDYLFFIMPAVMDYYGLRKAYDTIIQMTAQCVCGALVLALWARFTMKDKMVRRFVWFLTGMSVLALMPFIVQGLGYSYHIIPATTLLWMALGLIIYHALRKERQQESQTWAMMLVVILCAGGAYVAKAPWGGFISPATYRQLPLVQAAHDCGHKDCRVFIFGSHFEIPYLISYYAEAQWASRFPSLFFLPGQLADRSGEDDARKAQFRAMVAEDFKNYQPDTVLLQSTALVLGQGAFDFVSYFSQDELFSAQWQHYRHVGYIEAPYDDYLKDMKDAGDGLMRFDIYKRR